MTCDGLASRPGGVEILLAASCYGNRDKLRQYEPVWLIRLHSEIKVTDEFFLKFSLNDLFQALFRKIQ